MTVGVSNHMSNEQRVLRSKLIQLGANENTASASLSSSPWGFNLEESSVSLQYPTTRCQHGHSGTS